MKALLNHLANYQLFLGSRSPRRKLLLEELGIPFKVWLKEEVEETFSPHLVNDEVAKHLASIKAMPYKQELNSDQIVITADTIVCQGETILGKPNNKVEAFKMLRELSGTNHKVITGVCITGKDKSEVFSVTTEVWFSKLSDEEINYYIEQFQPFDKAGSYGIQEWIGLVAVESINGSYFNVMGLPVQRLYQELKRFTNYNSLLSHHE